MKYCRHCGKEVMEEAVFCPACGCATGYQPSVENPVGQTQAAKPEDKKDTALCVLSFFIPLFGLIFWLVTKEETPIKAKACGKWALISVLITVGLYILLFLFIFFMAMISTATVL